MLGLGSLLRLADDELDSLIARVLDNPRVQGCIERVTTVVAEKVTDHLLKEFLRRLEVHDER